ncbi:hypothetical protein CONPUDRAFT_137213 [Coniophora puteana RWD-64-598 SS2]|uniref:Alpha beta-hydrolase n=1 Tax=Coniophora puteana (strain RWD-64-598) TaxID=741705 RepID=A0A5M3MQX2_CONPW|nr:uncharacterized protein CONPUDRAFT_137213 [Coniophora puteana RWD-64-598 SS2]EIW81134.1 hypothetical protein CONPUDRAFT_137213 [Coniophora puteana RWD-64-598 SS2]
MGTPVDDGYHRFVKAITPPIVVNLHGARSLIWPSPTPKPTYTLLFVPGNPGLAEYYRTYLGEVHRLVNEAESQNGLEIVCVSQLGHDAASDGFNLEHEEVVNVDAQIKHKASVLDSLAARWSDTRGPPPRIILGGHSIGAYMALEVVRRKLNTVPVDAVHLLFPTVHHIGQTPNANKLAWLFRAAAGGAIHQKDGASSPDKAAVSFSPTLFMLLRAAIACLQLIPFFIIKSLILLASPTQNPHAVRATASLVLSPHAARQAIGMALDEMRSVTAVAPYPDPKEGGGVKIRAYWSKGDLDGWAPEAARVAAEEALRLSAFRLDDAQAGGSVLVLEDVPDRASMVCEVGMPHAFCLEHSEAMAKIAAAWIIHDYP